MWKTWINAAITICESQHLPKIVFLSYNILCIYNYSCRRQNAQINLVWLKWQRKLNFCNVSVYLNSHYIFRFRHSLPVSAALSQLCYCWWFPLCLEGNLACDLIVNQQTTRHSCGSHGLLVPDPDTCSTDLGTVGLMGAAVRAAVAVNLF